MEISDDEGGPNLATELVMVPIFLSKPFLVCCPRAQGCCTCAWGRRCRRRCRTGWRGCGLRSRFLCFTPSYTALVVWDKERLLLRRETMTGAAFDQTALESRDSGRRGLGCGRALCVGGSVPAASQHLPSIEAAPSFACRRLPCQQLLRGEDADNSAGRVCAGRSSSRSSSTS